MSRARSARIGRAYLTVTVDPATIARLSELAAARGVSRGRLIDAAIHALSQRSELLCCEAGCSNEAGARGPCASIKAKASCA